MPFIGYETLAGKRAALYARVSTEEQAMRGVSLDAQKERLFAFAVEKRLSVTGVYVDEGVSARKKYSARPQFMRMLCDAEKGLIDVIIFIKLDRWFRNVSDYYEVQGLLERNRVTWIATDEDYDTATANGRLALNIKLAIAQDESDRTSERIRFVFDNMIKDGRVISGKVPRGFVIKDKRLAVDEDGAMLVRRVFDTYIDCRSLSECARRIEGELGTRLDPKTVGRMISNRKYIGEGYGISDWCPSIIDTDTFALANTLLCSQKKSVGDRIYLFSGLAFCEGCGSRMSVYSKASGNKEFIYYRCPKHQGSACAMSRQISESQIEAVLLSAAEELSVAPIGRISGSHAKDGERLKKRLHRLNDLYVSGFIDKDEYETERKRLTDLTQVSSPSPIRSVNDYRLRELSRAEKKAFWSRTLEHIELSEENIRAFFYQPQATQPSGTATTITVSASINARRRF